MHNMWQTYAEAEHNRRAPVAHQYPTCPVQMNNPQLQPLPPPPPHEPQLGPHPMYPQATNPVYPISDSSGPGGHPFAQTNNMPFGVYGYGSYPYTHPHNNLSINGFQSGPVGMQTNPPNAPLGPAQNPSFGSAPNMETMSVDPTSPMASGSQPSNGSTASSRRRSRRSDDAGITPSRQGQQRLTPAQLLEYHSLLSAVDPASRRHIIQAITSNPVRFQQLYGNDQRSNPEVRLGLAQRRRALGRREEPKGLDYQNDGRPPAKEQSELTVNLECKACMTQLVNTVILPCGHAVLCQWCADQHIPSSRADPTRPRKEATCPMCRASVKQKVNFPSFCFQVHLVHDYTNYKSRFVSSSTRTRSDAITSKCRGHLFYLAISFCNTVLPSILCFLGILMRQFA